GTGREAACPHSGPVEGAPGEPGGSPVGQSRVGVSTPERDTTSDAGFDRRFLHELGQAPQDGRVCVGWHSVPKVEYMTRPPRGTRENSPRLGLDSRPRAKQQSGVEIALHTAFVADLLPAAV